MILDTINEILVKHSVKPSEIISVISNLETLPVSWRYFTTVSLTSDSDQLVESAPFVVSLKLDHRRIISISMTKTNTGIRYYDVMYTTSSLGRRLKNFLFGGSINGRSNT